MDAFWIYKDAKAVYTLAQELLAIAFWRNHGEQVKPLSKAQVAQLARCLGQSDKAREHAGCPKNIAGLTFENSLVKFEPQRWVNSISAASLAFPCRSAQIQLSDISHE